MAYIELLGLGVSLGFRAYSAFRAYVVRILGFVGTRSVFGPVRSWDLA